MLSASRYEWLCNVLLGLGTTAMMVGYDTSTFIVESVLHSVNQREPSRIEAKAGYYGQAIIYAFFAPACLFAPLFVRWLGPRRVLLIASLFFTAYILGFLYLNKFFYYGSCAGLGLGYALYYASQGCYMTEHSTKATVQRNSGMFGGFLCFSMIAGGAVLLALSFKEDSIPGSEEHADYHEYSDSMIRWIFGAFAVFGVISNVVFALLPPRRDSDPSMADIQGKMTIREQMKSLRQTLIARRMLLLAAMCLFEGVFTAFWLSVYPTTLIFTRALTHNKQLPGLYSLVFGIGVVSASVTVTLLSRRFANIGRWPSVTAFATLSMPAFVLVLLSTPNRSSIEPTNGESLLLEPSVPICLFIALLFGMADVFKTTIRSVICATLYPERHAETFSIAKLYQSAASCAMFFASPSLPMHWHVGILIVGEVVYLLAYFIVARKTAVLKKTRIMDSLSQSKISAAELNKCESC